MWNLSVVLICISWNRFAHMDSTTGLGSFICIPLFGLLVFFILPILGCERYLPSSISILGFRELFHFKICSFLKNTVQFYKILLLIIFIIIIWKFSSLVVLQVWFPVQKKQYLKTFWKCKLFGLWQGLWDQKFWADLDWVAICMLMSYFRTCLLLSWAPMWIKIHFLFLWPPFWVKKQWVFWIWTSEKGGKCSHWDLATEYSI
jgi:hypothetical protein